MVTFCSSIPPLDDSQPHPYLLPPPLFHPHPPHDHPSAGGRSMFRMVAENCGRWGEGQRSLWTKYCLLCTLCGSAATILAAIFLVVAALFRYYTTSIHYFETVPTYLPAILLSICGVSTIAFSCKRNRNIILLRITACWSLLSAGLSSVITITTSLIHMNRLQTLKECAYNHNPPACSCYSHVFPMATPPDVGVTYVFENTPDCEVIHGILYSCLRAVFAISVVAVLLSIFLCMLLYQLIGHERKKAYWSRIRRVNSDWSTDFIACLARPMPREGSSVMPLVMSPNAGMPHAPLGWGPPPPYEQVADDPPTLSTRPFLRPLFSHHHHQTYAMPPPPPRAPLRLVTSHSENSFTPSPHPFSPTITSVDPVQVFNHHYSLSHGNVGDVQENIVGGRGQLSMSSITSLSIPDTLKSTQSVGSGFSSLTTAEEQAELEDLQETSIEANTCKSVASESVFEQDSLEDISSAVVEDLPLDTDTDLDNAQLLPNDKLLSTKARTTLAKISSLPCSPLVKRGIRMLGKSQQNLNYVNLEGEWWRPKRLRHASPKKSVLQSPRKLVGSSLPGSPNPIRKGFWGRRKKLSLEESNFTQD